MTRAVLSIGSNVGDRLAHLRGCARGFAPVLLAASPVYATAPWGGVAQREFLNAVLLVSDDAAAPRDWLERAQQQERLADRRRGARWGPRTLDVDLIAVDGVCSTAEHLTLPHPWAHRRAFVLLPWRDAEPEAVLPGHGPLAALIEQLPEAERAAAVRRDDLELVAA